MPKIHAVVCISPFPFFSLCFADQSAPPRLLFTRKAGIWLAGWWPWVSKKPQTIGPHLRQTSSGLRRSWSGNMAVFNWPLISPASSWICLIRNSVIGNRRLPEPQKCPSMLVHEASLPPLFMCLSLILLYFPVKYKPHFGCKWKNGLVRSFPSIL